MMMSNKERPILFSTDMVKAILNNSKTITRRVITKHNSIIGEGGDWNKLDFDGKEILSDNLKQFFVDCPEGSLGNAIVKDGYRCTPWVDNSYPDYKYLHVAYDWHNRGVIYRVYPRYDVGDLLWVKETWFQVGDGHDMPFIVYKAKTPDQGCKWRSSRFMPKWACRIWLEVVSVKPERGQDISEDDAKAEGCWITNPDKIKDL